MELYILTILYSWKLSEKYFSAYVEIIFHLVDYSIIYLFIEFYYKQLYSSWSLFGFLDPKLFQCFCY